MRHENQQNQQEEFSHPSPGTPIPSKGNLGQAAQLWEQRPTRLRIPEGSKVGLRYAGARDRSMARHLPTGRCRHLPVFIWRKACVLRGVRQRKATISSVVWTCSLVPAPNSHHPIRQEDQAFLERQSCPSLGCMLQAFDPNIPSITLLTHTPPGKNSCKWLPLLYSTSREDLEPFTDWHMGLPGGQASPTSP